MNETIRQYIRVFLLGNAVREYIAPMLIGREFPLNYDSSVVIVRDERNTATDIRADFTVIQSERVPYNTLLIVPAHNKDFETMQLGIRDSVIFLDDWTFHNSETLEMAQRCRTEHPYCGLKIILCPSGRKTLSTDVTNIQSALNEAIAAYERENFTVFVLQNTEISDQFFWKGRKYADILRQKFGKDVQDAKKSLEHNYNLRYEVFLRTSLEDEMLLHANLEKFTCYDNAVGSREKSQFINTASQTFFTGNSQFVTELQALFKIFTRQICLWDEAKVLEHLLYVLAQRFKKDMTLALPQVNFSGIGEATYVMLMNETHFDIEFQLQCRNFFYETAKNFIKKYIAKLFDKLEGLL